MDKSPNRLINEKSPYLLQHAYNPVDWYPWSEEAFAKAKAEDKPVFLSIGYSTCHWCHVMERESFEDDEVAAYLNKHFVSIKVDREERPDIDQIYMTVCQAMTGSGGWPLTVLLTSDKKPFFAGTYFPKESKWGRPGLMDVLRSVHKEWQNNRELVVWQGNKIAESLKANVAGKGQPGQLTAALLDQAYTQFERTFDERYGGFGSAPKFPVPHNLMFLLRYWRQKGEKKALAMVETTLEAMRQGGIYDHLGFGFARYSTDAKWLVPHFEKMLYDNALLCYTYLEAWQCTGNADFRQVAEEILTYVLRDMTSLEGGFYSAEDADSEGVEGKFYVFRYDEVLDLLGEKDGKIFADFYDITPAGNFEHGQSIMNYIGKDLRTVAARHNMTEQELAQLLERCRITFYNLREKRIHPFKDDKVLTAWNALMIAAMAKAARATGEAKYRHAAAKALSFIYRQLVRPDGRLLARYRDGEAAHLAQLDDYAFLLWALLEMYQTTYAAEYVEKALVLAEQMKALFWDEEGGGFFFTGIDNEELIVRPKEIYDGALPSGNSVAAAMLIKLSRLTEREEYALLAEQTLAAFSSAVSRYPAGYSFYMMALQLYLTPPLHVVIAGEASDPTTQAMLKAAEESFVPGAVVVFHAGSEDIAKLFPYAIDKTAKDGRATAYICQNFACQAPVYDVASLVKLLDKQNIYG
ncbi:thioredoxin domain-containing protein [Sporolituus thermophilus]|uniref:Spermatogenesis-associated protein 20-like TRX domain-containing protein n=1 Tax=Sporolituus thermophilus DSM 23256 TaxID=1123285 RepID=A0A1G7NYC5_9FIRM|nr:thioredoxin domain-containing protein [Sporolituus thermophilus]SDF78200.1 hypothetical protein SAMN05660235_02734 [Sporolituus thermophilus DSM 23256]